MLFESTLSKRMANWHQQTRFGNIPKIRISRKFAQGILYSIGPDVQRQGSMAI